MQEVFAASLAWEVFAASPVQPEAAAAVAILVPEGVAEAAAGTVAEVQVRAEAVVPDMGPAVEGRQQVAAFEVVPVAAARSTDWGQ